MKIINVVGARPNFMKVAPLIRAMKKREDRFVPMLVHTGQHYDENMSGYFFRQLGIPEPDINLGIGHGSHAEQTGKIMIEFEKVLLQHKPDLVIVVGDVNSTVACSLVASKLGIRIAHVEAGLRSFDRTMPEEINRIVTDALADILFTPSPDGNENLIREGVLKSKIKLVGNIMIDTLIANLEKARKKNTHLKLGLKQREFVYVTLHRPSNVDDQRVISGIMTDLHRLALSIPVVFPVHPRTKKMLYKFSITNTNNPGLIMSDPVEYHDSICLAENARFVLTDSGGLQEETTFFRTPCLTLRPNTERPITITEGSNKLTNPECLWADIENILSGPYRFGKVPYLWDGHTAERIVQHLQTL